MRNSSSALAQSVEGLLSAPVLTAAAQLRGLRL